MLQKENIKAKRGLPVELHEKYKEIEKSHNKAKNLKSSMYDRDDYREEINY